LLVRRDAEVVKNQALADIPPERRALVMKAIAESFEKGAQESETATKAGYQAMDDAKLNVIV